MLTLRGHSGAVMALAFSPDGSLLASASRDSTVRMWDVAGREVRRLDSPWPALCVAWSPDGNRLASGYESTVLQWWEAPAWDRSLRCDPHISACHSVAFIAPANLVSASVHQLLRHNLGNGNLERRRELRQNIERMVIDSQGRPAALLVNGKIVRLDTALNHAAVVTEGLTSGRPLALCASPQSTALAVALPRHIGLWSGVPRELPRTWRAHEARMAALTFTADGRRLLSAAADGLVKRWNLDTFTATAVHDFGIGECYSLAVSPDGLRAAVGGLEDIVVWDLEG